MNSEDLQPSELRIGLVGYGHLGRFHAQKIAKLASLNKVCFSAILELSPIQQGLAKKNHPNVEITADATEFAKCVDAVVIATPTTYHQSLYESFWQQGKHILCEKPLCRWSEVERELSPAQLSHQVFQVGHSERYHEIWESLEISPERNFWVLKRMAPYKGRGDDVDIVQDLMIHDIDLMLWQTKSLPLKVQAWGQSGLHKNIDTVYARFTFPGQLEVQIEASRLNPIEERFCHFFNENIQIDLLRNRVFNAKNPLDGKQLNWQAYSKRDHLQLELNDFVNSIQKKTPAKIDFEQGKNAVRVGKRVVESLRQNGLALGFYTHLI